MSQSPISQMPATSSTADQEVLVKVEGVSKKFCRSLKKSLWYGLCDIGGELNPFRRQVAKVACDELRVTIHNKAAEGGSILPATSYPPLATSSPLRDGEFWAVNDVSFELRRGECLGLIGHNGAGKTTLLKMLNGLIKPDVGKITMRGRIGALIALGAGFNPILTGRENIYINGSVLGLSKKEIDGKIDEIIDFAEIGEFIDTPVQNYSSGMSVRLGFAVATALDPDVLILDEVLAVGDAKFRSKCYRRIDNLRSQSAVILVTHNMEHVGRVCSHGLSLRQGKTHYFGGVLGAVEDYQTQNDSELESFIRPHPPVTRAQIKLNSSEIQTGQNLEIVFQLSISATESVLPRFVVFDAHQQIVAEGNSLFNAEQPREIAPGECVLRYRIGPMHLRGGKYTLHANLHDAKGALLVGGFNAAAFTVRAARIGETSCQLEVKCQMP